VLLQILDNVMIMKWKLYREEKFYVLYISQFLGKYKTRYIFL